MLGMTKTPCLFIYSLLCFLQNNKKMHGGVQAPQMLLDPYNSDRYESRLFIL